MINHDSAKIHSNYEIALFKKDYKTEKYMLILISFLLKTVGISIVKSNLLRFIQRFQIVGLLDFMSLLMRVRMEVMRLGGERVNIRVARVKVRVMGWMVVSAGKVRAGRMGLWMGMGMRMGVGMGVVGV